ncbi:polycomb group protein EMBRYONIC FLOWER 2 [Artemisia annua]|uniref:Polycomb group protein EMBRYONIC FLOWER 2 n=1 Tax=Artemisia annua TaxID=35608 RepID=A0A2U1KVV4_ARTAN|nr:polycomb group protein EMBRYONIC FLOWER 2 [Artemisia annua]
MMVNLKLEVGRIKIWSAEDTSDFEEVQISRMPVILSVFHEAKKSGGPALPVGQFTAEEEAAAEERREVYLKPVTYYNILQDRAKVKPSFLARSLRYKLQEKHTKKVQLSVFISEAIGDKIHTQTIFPLYILLARQDPTPNGETLRSSSYHFKKAIKLTASDGTQAKFNLPEIKNLSAEVKDLSFSILLLTGADHTNPNEMDRTISQMLTQSCFTAYAGECVMGKVPIDDILHKACKTPNSSLGEKLQSISTVSMQSCRMKATFPNVVTFQFPYNSESVQVPVVVTAEEAGAEAIDNNDILLPPGLGLIPGEVTFNFKGYNGIVCETEGTDYNFVSFYVLKPQVFADYSCAFCLLPCGSYKGLKCHLQASHGLFDYEFLEDEKYQLVNASYNKSDDFISQNFGILADEDMEFFFCQTPLQKGCYFHSHGAQMLNNLVDVTQDQEDFMNLWNSFIRKQRLVAEADTPWACEAFLTEHGKDLVGTPMLMCSWRSFMTQLWKGGLIDVKTFTNCNKIIENISKN